MQSVTRKAENINQEVSTAPTQETSSSSLSKLREKVSRIALTILDYIKSLIPIYSVFHHHKTRVNYKEQNDILKKRIEKCDSMLDERYEAIETLLKENSNLKAKTKTSSTQTISPRSEHKKLRSKIEELESEVRRLTAENQKLESQQTQGKVNHRFEPSLHTISELGEPSL